MPMMYTFCTWFSVRLGSIIVAILSLIQGVILLVFSILGLQAKDEISAVTEYLVKEYDMLFYTSHFLILQYYTKEFFVALILFFVIYITACILLVRGAMQLKICEIVPFTVCEFVRINTLLYTETGILILVKKHVLDFNILIVCIITGGFVLLFLYYSWFCPVSLIQCLLIVRRNDKSKKEAETKIDHRRPDSTLILHYDYLSSDFKIKPKQSNENYYRYQYGNLPKLVF